MATTIADELKDWFESLTATSVITTALGDTFTFGTNLSIGVETNATQVLTIIPYGGGAPSVEGERQNPSVQLRFKTPNRARGWSVMQSIINTIHNKKEVITKGRLWATNSSPVLLPIVREGGEQVIYVASFTARHIKF